MWVEERERLVGGPWPKTSLFGSRRRRATTLVRARSVEIALDRSSPVNQSQKAGSGSKQIQVYGDYYDGVTEERAAEIARQQAQEVIATYSLDAAPVAGQRIEDFSTQLLEVLSDEKVLGALSDPGFQISLRKAQMSAAATEEEGDYETLARLLGERAKRNVRPIRASIDRAIEIIDKLDESALQGLTLAWVVGGFAPSSGQMGEGLDFLERMWASVPHDNLPQGGAWLDHLDMLNLIRYSSITTLKKMNELLQSQVPGYFSSGLTQEEVDALNAAAREIRPDLNFIVVPHELKPGLFRLPFSGVSTLATEVAVKFDKQDHDSIVQLAQSNGQLGQVDASAAAAIDAEIAKRPGLALVRDWYDQIPHALQFTGAGIAVAFVIAQKHKTPLSTDKLEELLPK